MPRSCLQSRAIMDVHISGQEHTLLFSALLDPKTGSPCTYQEVESARKPRFAKPPGFVQLVWRMGMQPLTGTLLIRFCNKWQNRMKRCYLPRISKSRPNFSSMLTRIFCRSAARNCQICSRCFAPLAIACAC